MPRRHARSRRLAYAGLAAEVARRSVVVERVGRRDRVGLAAHPLDPLGRLRALPQADQPQTGDAPAGERRRAPRRGSRRASGCRGRRSATAGRARHRCSWRSARPAASRPNRTRTPRARRRRTRTTAPGPGRRRDHPRRHRGARAAPAEPQMERPLLLGEDADRDVHPPDQLLEALAEQPRPSARGRSGAGRTATSVRARAGRRMSSRSEVPWSSTGGPSPNVVSRRAIASR